MTDLEDFKEFFKRHMFEVSEYVDQVGDTILTICPPKQFFMPKMYFNFNEDGALIEKYTRDHI